MDDGPILVDKPMGATPLQALDSLRQARPDLASEKLAYAGRLDPMATGLLVALIGPLLARQEHFWNLDKAYEATMLLGVSTDSHDLLGLPELGVASSVTDARVADAARSLVGKSLLPIPMFSSYRVQGRPLFSWARSGVSPDATPVARIMTVSEVLMCGVEQEQLGEIAGRACERVALVLGDFRQGDISERWRHVARQAPDRVITAVHLVIHCSSGTYIRSLAHALGRRLGVGACVGDLRRIRVGHWSVDDPSIICL